MNPRFPVFAAVVLLALSAGRTAAAHDFVVDQSNEPTPMSHHSIQYYMPLGQEFVPTMPQLDVVELDILDLSGTGPAELRVRIRHDAFDGPVLGESAIVTMAPWHDGALHFDFPEPVPLTPGQRHIIEVVLLSGSNPMLGSGDDTRYDNGRGFLRGEFIADDFWFRTGLDRSVPVRPRTWGGLKALYR